MVFSRLLIILTQLPIRDDLCLTAIWENTFLQLGLAKCVFICRPRSIRNGPELTDSLENNSLFKWKKEHLAF